MSLQLWMKNCGTVSYTHLDVYKRQGVSGVDALYKELKYMVQVLGMTLEEALPYMTCQVAEGLDLSLIHI